MLTSSEIVLVGTVGLILALSGLTSLALDWLDRNMRDG